MKKSATKYAPKNAKKFTSYYEPDGEKLVTLVNYILDKSGSMQSVKSQVLSGFEEYINGLKSKMDNESRLLFSLTLFDSNGSIRLDKPYLVTPIQDVNPLNNSTYVTGGQTPLYDAIGKTIAEVDNTIKVRGLKIHRILTVIHTDGQENDSREFDSSAINRLREEKEKTGHWTFVYIGASPTTWADASKLGFNKLNTMAYDPLQTKGMFTVAANATMNYRASNDTSSRAFFSGGSKFIGTQEVKFKKRNEHLSSDGYTRYTATEWRDGTWSCNCPGWAFKKSCKHIGGGVSA